MIRLRGSIAAQLVLSYGILGIVSMLAVSAVFYISTVGMLDHIIDTRIKSHSQRLADEKTSHVAAQLVGEVEHELDDGLESEREIYLVLAPDGHPLVGNIRPWSGLAGGIGKITSHGVVRNGAPTQARLLVRRLDDGGMFILGYDLSEQESIRAIVLRSLGEVALLSLLLTVGGALLFRRQIERRIGDIRHATKDISAGNLSRRIAVTSDDEFGLLNRDINTMMDRIEHLMDGIRNVSNAIAHDLRTPLTRIRGKLDDAVRHELNVEVLADAAHGAIVDIDDLIRLFERLLQIAEVESGMGSRAFEQVDLQRIVRDMAEMYDATAEAHQVQLTIREGGPVLARADRNLIASAVASLIDNAIKHTAAGSAVEVYADIQAGSAVITVADNGPGIPEQERDKVVQRFYRLDKSRAVPGNGLGLSIVDAIVKMHGGALQFEDGKPGLVARMVLPRARK